MKKSDFQSVHKTGAHTQKHKQETVQYIETLTKELEEKEERYKRVLADYNNFQRRVGEEKEKFIKMAGANCLLQMLEPFDHLETAQQHMKNTGLEIIVRQFLQVFEREGVKEFAAVGEQFNPSMMEAIALVKGEKDKVIRVHQKGYTLDGALLRPAKVEVGSGE